jgi:hypothetical protein
MRSWLTGQLNDRGVLCTSAVVVLLALSALGRDVDAQVLRGTIRIRDDSVRVDGARIAAENRKGRRLAEGVTDDEGRYFLRLPSTDGEPIRLSVTRIGMQPMMSDEFLLTAADTLEADLFMKELATELAEVRTTGVASLNTQRLQYATRRGWRVYGPEVIDARREAASGLNELLRSLGAPGLMVPMRPGDCVKTTRTGQCLAVILDGVLISGAVHLNPRDIFFLAVVGSSDARLEWGDRAAYGALAIYTRMAGDPRRP